MPVKSVPQKRQGLQIATLHILWGGCPKHRWQVTLVPVLTGSKQVLRRTDTGYGLTVSCSVYIQMLRELEQTASQRLALLSPIFSECGRQLTVYKVQWWAETHIPQSHNKGVVYRLINTFICSFSYVPGTELLNFWKFFWLIQLSFFIHSEPRCTTSWFILMGWRSVGPLDCLLVGTAEQKREKINDFREMEAWVVPVLTPLPPPPSPASATETVKNKYKLMKIVQEKSWTTTKGLHKKDKKGPYVM